MKKLWALALFLFVGCSENYSNGERIGLLTQFSSTGIFWKSWEGHLNLTQTGMNSSVPFDFSIDNDRESENLVATLDSAATQGWKIKLKYQQVWGLINVFQNRGETNHFITSVEVLDKDPMGSVFGNNTDRIEGSSNVCGKVVDTIYVVIDKSR